MIVSGHERITISGVPDWRWWVMIDEPLERYFPRRAGRVSATYGRFIFARGGRCLTEDECLHERSRAIGVARAELAEFVRRPTHALGPHGELIPLGGNQTSLDEPLVGRAELVSGGE